LKGSRPLFCFGHLTWLIEANFFSKFSNTISPEMDWELLVPLNKSDSYCSGVDESKEILLEPSKKLSLGLGWLWWFSGNCFDARNQFDCTFDSGPHFSSRNILTWFKIALAQYLFWLKRIKIAKHVHKRIPSSFKFSVRAIRYWHLIHFFKLSAKFPLFSKYSAFTNLVLVQGG